MPARKKFLPRPCPICGRKNGTIQLVFFGGPVNALVVRIGHYSAKLRNDVTSSSKIQGLDEEKARLRKKKAERKWCSFRSEATSELEYEITKGRFYWKNETWSFRPPNSFLNRVYEGGWEIKGSSGSNYKGRIRKNIDYWEKDLIDNPQTQTRL